MGKALTLTTAVEKRGPAAALVAGTVVGLRVVRMGGENLIGLSKAARAALGVAIGDAVHVTIEFDESPREVHVPDALAEALAAEPTLKAAFDSLSYTMRKQHARSVAEAKREETRVRRVAAVLASLGPE